MSCVVTLAHQVGQNTRIDGSGPGAHHQALQWSESHGGVDAVTILNRCQRAAIPKMAGYTLERAESPTKQLSGALGAILMVDPVEAVAANSLRKPLVRPWVNKGRFR